MNIIEKYQLVYSKLKSAKHLLIVGHTSPDADALASIGAIIEVARDLSLSVLAYADKKPENVYNFIPFENLVSSEEPDNLLSFDLIIILDCGSISRTGLEARIRTLLKADESRKLTHRPYIIEIDHHQPQEKYADLEIRLPDKASTTEIIYAFLKANNLKISKTMASCILIGLITDTGNFLHDNSTEEVMAVSSEMLLGGASFSKIISNTVNNKSFLSLKVWGLALNNLDFNQDTGLAVSALRQTDLDNLSDGRGTEDVGTLCGGIVSFMAGIKGVKVALFLREENGFVKGSLRTNQDGIDVAKIAANWHGGGHKKAAGFTVHGSLKRKESKWIIEKKLDD